MMVVIIIFKSVSCHNTLIFYLFAERDVSFVGDRGFLFQKDKHKPMLERQGDLLFVEKVRVSRQCRDSIYV